MKKFGVVLVLAAIIAALVGVVMISEAVKDPRERDTLAATQLRLCELHPSRLDTDGCVRELGALQQQQAQTYLQGGVVLGLAPLALILGTILFAAGKIEDRLPQLPGA